jgi:hypothetical protein
MEVPDKTAVAESSLNQVDKIETPGANKSTQVPKLEKDARASVLPVAPTVIAAGTLAGETVHEFKLLFPAATTYVIPEFIELTTALSSAFE